MGKRNSNSRFEFFKTYGWACLLAAAAIAIRLWRLGAPALRADTIVIWNICSSGLSPAEIAGRWMELMGVSGQFPVPVMMIRLFLDLLRLPVTEFNIRLLDVFWAGIAVFAAFQAGRILISKRAGMVWAGLMTVHPYFIQATREPYYYAPMLCGLTLMAWGVALVIGGATSKEPANIQARFYIPLTAGGFALALYSQPSGWGLIGLTLAAIYLALLIKKQWRGLIILSAVLFLLALPMLFAPWGISQVLALTAAEQQQQNLRLLAGETRKPLLEHLYGVWLTFSWGRGTARGLLAPLAALLWIECIRRNWRNPRHLALAALLLGGAALSVFAQLRAATFQSSRYMISVFPLLLGCYAQGVVSLLERLDGVRLGPLVKRGAKWCVIALFFAPLLPPAAWALRLSGSPTPYKDIIRWVDTRLPRGTPVLVDRWFEPWNEFKVYPSTNVFLTFTVPNEPLDTFLQVNWRETAVRFFKNFPDAAYMEMSKTYWEKPEVGPWDWPREHFRNHAVIRNEAALKLREAGLLYRDEGGVYTNRISIEIFYNTRDDHLAARSEAGDALAFWYGPGWGYTKTQDYRDWRVLTAAAELEAHNLAAVPRENVFIAIRGAAANGAKRVRVNNQALEFPEGRVEERTIGPMSLAPGATILTLRDPHWTGQGPLLLVEKITVSEPD